MKKKKTILLQIKFEKLVADINLNSDLFHKQDIVLVKQIIFIKLIKAIINMPLNYINLQNENNAFLEAH